MQALETYLDFALDAKKRRRLLAATGTPLLVCTFVEDAARVLLRWDEQKRYLVSIMRIPAYVAMILLLASATVQLTSAALIVRPRHYGPSRVKAACYALIGFICVQPFMYGQHADADFLCRSFTVIGGLLLLVWSEKDHQRRREDTGLPQDLSDVSSDRLQLVGRLLLTFLFFFQALYSEKGGLHNIFVRPSFFLVLSGVLLLGLSALICVGFHTEWSALLLCAVLFVSNFFMYPYWSMHQHVQDYYRYYFYQTLSIIGGLMLLALHGPGGISIDKGNKKAI